MVGFDLGPLLQGQMRRAKVKSAYNLLIIGPRGLGCKPTYMKSWAGNLLVWQDLTLGPSFKVKRIAKVKSAYNSLLLVLEVLDGKPTYRKSWAGNLLVWLGLTLGPSFKVKRG